MRNLTKTNLFYAEISELKAKIRELKDIHLEIKCKITSLQQESDKLSQEKRKVEQQVHLLQAKNYKLNHTQPTWSNNEKKDLESKIALLQEKNQQLQCFKNYQDKLVSAKRFCTFKTIGEEECLWIQSKHEKKFRVCAKCGKNGHSKSWCRFSTNLTFP